MFSEFCSKATNLAAVTLAALTQIETLTSVSMIVHHRLYTGTLDVKHMAYCSAACMQADYSRAEA